MKRQILIPIFVLTLSIEFFGCKNSSEPDPFPVPLVSNPSFESNGMPSLAGWSIRDSMSVRAVRTAPMGGGNWSMSIEAAPFPGSYAWIKIPSEPGTHRYRFSLWCKKEGVTLGSAGLFFSPHDTTSRLPLNFLPVNDTVWTFFSFNDTITASPRDSMRIILIGGPDDEGVGNTYFDLCTLERLD